MMARNFGVASLLSASIGLCAVLLCDEPAPEQPAAVRAPVARVADDGPRTLAVARPTSAQPRAERTMHD